jgi:hypothetical protein
MIELVNDVKSSLFLSCQKSSWIQDFTADPQRDAQRERERERERVFKTFQNTFVQEEAFFLKLVHDNKSFLFFFSS